MSNETPSPVAVTPAERDLLARVATAADDLRRSASRLEADALRLKRMLDEGSFFQTTLGHQEPRDIWQAHARLEELIHLSHMVLSEEAFDLLKPMLSGTDQARAYRLTRVEGE